MSDKRTKLQCPDCPYSTASEARFVVHLEEVHAFRSHQAAREIAKQQSKESAAA